jgi:hypothetical protein
VGRDWRIEWKGQQLEVATRSIETGYGNLITPRESVYYESTTEIDKGEN